MKIQKLALSCRSCSLHLIHEGLFQVGRWAQVMACSLACNTTLVPWYVNGLLSLTHLSVLEEFKKKSLKYSRTGFKLALPLKVFMSAKKYDRFQACWLNWKWNLDNFSCWRYCMLKYHVIWETELTYCYLRQKHPFVACNDMAFKCAWCHHGYFNW